MLPFTSTVRRTVSRLGVLRSEDVVKAPHIGRPQIPARRRPVRPSVKRRPASPLLSVLVALVLPAVAVAKPSDIQGADLSTTGNHSELVRFVPIANQPHEKERVVMSLGPEKLPSIGGGDGLWAGAEVQVSTTCVIREPRCHGRRYDFNPWITARLVLAAEPSPTSPGLALSEERLVHCKQRRPNRNHHCTLALPTSETTVVDAAALPCPPDACYVNLILGAWAPKAQPGNLVVVGADLPDGEIEQDKGRINLITESPDDPLPLESSSAVLVNDTLSLDEPDEVKRRVIHSVEIPVASKGDVLAVDASYLAAIDDVRYNTFIGSRVIVADDPLSTKPSGIGKEVARSNGKVTEHNGFNCTLGKSGYSTPCLVVKAGATRITRDAVDDQGEPIPLYVNLVAGAAPKFPEEPGPFGSVSLSAAGGLRVLRFPAE